ncbi:MAG: CHAT domain-containing protein [Gemmatimonadetes bacterium]|nr:CHAT domain-containing protein [Gemmatimonadota bacterium]
MIAQSAPSSARLQYNGGMLHEGTMAPRLASITILAAFALTVWPGETPGAGPVPVDSTLFDTLKQLEEERAHAAVDSIAAAAIHAHAFPARADSVKLGDLVAARVRARFASGMFTDSTTFALGLQAIEVKERAAGPEALTTAESIHDFGTIMYRRGRFDEAVAHLERAHGILAAIVPLDELRLSNVEYTLGSVLKRAGEYDRAETHILAALEKRRRLADGFEPKVALSLNQLANLYSVRGEPTRSIRAYRDAIAILEGHEDEYAHWYGAFMANLASELRIVGRFDEARRTYAIVNQVLARAFGPDDPRLASSLEGQGILLMKFAEYGEARRLLNRALAITEKSEGADSYQASTIHDNLAIIASDLGDHEQAIAIGSRSLAIKRAVYGESHEQIAISLNNLGVDHFRMGDYESAKEYAAAALAMRGEILGGDHPLYASTLINQGNVFSHSGDTERAMVSYRQAAEIYRKAYGERHPKYAESLQSVAHEYYARGEYGDAIPILRDAIVILRSAFGASHPLVARARGLLAEALLQAGDTDGAFREALQSENETRDVLRSCYRSLPEPEALRYAQRQANGLGTAMALWAGDVPASGTVAELWDAVVRSRGLLFDEMSARKRFLAEADDPEVARLFRELEKATRRVANLVVHGPEGLSPEQYGEYIADAQADREEWERKCEEASRYFRAERAQARIGYADAVRNLGEREALVGVRRYEHGDPGNERGSSYYMAFLKRGDSESAVAIPLGSAAEIDFLASLWRAEIDRGFEGDADLARRAGEKLRAAVWDPVAYHLDGIESVWLVPDGAFHTIQLEALPAPGGGYLIEESREINLLSTERDLAPRNVYRKAGRGVLVVGAPDFDRARAARAAAGRDTASRDEFGRARTLPARAAMCLEFRALTFPRLPASALEATDVAGAWKRWSGREPVRSLTGATADESRFKTESAGKRHIHVATHAFFLGEECGVKPAVGSGPGADFGAGATGISPLLLSGLAFAGSNTRDELDLEGEDGILTAEEIASLNLRGVEAAVLSGCETGGGVVRLGEGVFGLRRAFQLAGVRTLVMSLWRIEDDWARRWMKEYYEAGWGRGLGASASVREASRSILAARREAGLSDHPFFWAGFVAVGAK